MKKYLYIIITTLTVTLAVTGCNDKEFLNIKPTDKLTPDVALGSDPVVLSVVADFYNRLPDAQRNTLWYEWFVTNEALAAFGPDYWRNGQGDYAYDVYRLWDYAFIRDLNFFLENIQDADPVKVPSKNRFIAEVRYMRAYMYFEMVKRMGGVPLITKTLTYNTGDDPLTLQYPRAKEAEVYDFVLAEMEAIKNDLPSTPNTKARATKALALATRSRAALYAASIAKYGATTPTVTLAGGEVGIEASKAAAYYDIALKSAQEIINGQAGAYALYTKFSATDIQDNFARLFLDKASNPEVIFVKDYKLPNTVQRFTEEVIPRSNTETGATGGKMGPTLNLAQEFELLATNSIAPFKNTEDDGSPVYYNNVQDIFAGRDARLGGTLILPGAVFKAKAVDIFAGYVRANNTVVTSNVPAGTAVLETGNPAVKVVGADGPIDRVDFTTQTGFLLRKYVDPTPGAAQFPGSENWYIRYRYAEVLLNAAEAAFELGQPELAANYMSQVRRRAGFTTDLTAADINFDRIVHERNVEFAFEGHRFFDLKRWRLAHLVWNGSPMTVAEVTQNIGKRDKKDTNGFGLWPYKYYAPGDPNDGKWLFRIVKPSTVTNARNFRLGTYYTSLDNVWISNNPKLVRNPNQ